MSSMQKARRHDPYPWTWEVPLLVLVVVMLGLAAGVQVGRSLANLLAGAGWTWPIDQAAFWRSIPAVAAGDARAGLNAAADAGAAAATSAAGGLASPALVWAGIAIVEVLFLTAAGCASTWGLQRWGPGRLIGMATRAEAEQMLGLTRLRKVSPIVRPDLHGKHPRPLHPISPGECKASTQGLGLRPPLRPTHCPPDRSGASTKKERR